MSNIEDIPFKIPMGALHEPLEEIREFTAPDINTPDCLQILNDTQYDFTLETWALSRLPSLFGLNVELPHRPSCPPHWMLFSSPSESRKSRRRSREPNRRYRSASLNSCDPPLQYRTVKFLLKESECGYSEDDEGSPTEDNIFFNACQCGERPRSSGGKCHGYRLMEIHQDCSPHRSRQSPTRNAPRPRRSKSTGGDIQVAVSPQRMGSPQCQRATGRRSSGGKGNARIQQGPATVTAFFSLPRPSTAGHVSPARSHKSTAQRSQRCKTSHGRPSGQDPSSELLSALSQDERELLDAVTDRGYSLRTAITALQRTGLRKPEQILRYLKACKKLRGLGYDQAQVEEALEMFQYSESKAAEFLRLLTQFNEMGFQQNAIKEVLLVHGNHRERALEELMNTT